jgi:hypothetical protein
MNKLSSTIGFLVALVFAISLTARKQQRFARNIRTTNTGVIDYALAMALLFLSFVQFWLLTRIFPGSVILCLVIASLAGVMIYTVIGAVAGFGLQQEKINVVTMIWMGRHPGLACLLMVIGLVYILVIAVGSLYVFWRQPIGSAYARVWIAFFLFIVPQLVAVTVMLLLGVSMVTSELIDDDVRNSYVSGQFSNIIYSTISLVFPVWIFRQEIAQVFHLTLPSWLYGLVLSVPLLVFLIGGIVPFFVGMYRYRLKAQSLLKWRSDWLKSVQKVLSLPKSSPQRTQLFQEKLSKLMGQIDARRNENELLKFYTKLRPPEHDVSAPSLPARDPALATPDSVPPNSPQPPPANSPKPGFSASSGLPDPFKEIRTIIEDHEEILREWDIQFHDLDRLTELYRSLSGIEPVDIDVFVQNELKDTNEELAALNPKRNMIAAFLLTVLPGAGSWLLTTQWGIISKLVENLMTRS